MDPLSRVNHTTYLTSSPHSMLSLCPSSLKISLLSPSNQSKPLNRKLLPLSLLHLLLLHLNLSQWLLPQHHSLSQFSHHLHLHRSPLFFLLLLPLLPKSLPPSLNYLIHRLLLLLHPCDPSRLCLRWRLFPSSKPSLLQRQ